VVITSIATFGEEFGWRGYLQPRLSHLGPLRSMLLVGVIWGVWHAPIIAQGHNYPAHPALGVVLMIAFTTIWSVILGWLFLASRSVLAPTIGHASINSPAASLGAFVAGANPLLSGIVGAPGIAVAGLVALWLWRSRRLAASPEATERE
jgi:membrane protease YdiL (CAAX protease family)